jgi:hypothetical protein
MVGVGDSGETVWQGDKRELEADLEEKGQEMKRCETALREAWTAVAAAVSEWRVAQKTLKLRTCPMVSKASACARLLHKTCYRTVAAPRRGAVRDHPRAVSQNSPTIGSS